MQGNTSILFLSSRSAVSSKTIVTLASVVQVQARSVSFLVANLAVPLRMLVSFLFSHRMTNGHLP